MFGLARIIFPRPKFRYEEELSFDEPYVYVSNHAEAIGPVYTKLYFPEPKTMWLINYIMKKGETSEKFIYHDFFHATGKKNQGWWKFMAKLLSKLLVPLFRSVPHIEVYHDARMVDTFRQSVEALEKGNSLVIFPECPTRHAPMLNDFYHGFADLGRMYYNATGKILKFVPVYLCDDLKIVSVGKPIEYDINTPARKQREQLSDALRDSIVKLANALPKHTYRTFLSEDWYEHYGQYVENPAEYWKLFD